MPQTFTLPKQVVIDPLTGNPAPGAKAYFYITETSTPKPVYSDADLTTAITQPVEADAAGVLQVIYFAAEGDYKLTLNRADDSLLYTVDPLGSLTGLTILSTQIKYDITPAERDALLTIVDASRVPGCVNRYGTNTVPGTTDMTAAWQAAIDSGHPVSWDYYFQGYAIYDTLTIADKQAFEFVGDMASFASPTNAYATLQWKGSGSNKVMLQIKNTSASGAVVYGIGLEKLSLDGYPSGATTRALCGIAFGEFGTSTNQLIKFMQSGRVSIRNCRYGCWFGYDLTQSDDIESHCHDAWHITGCTDHGFALATSNGAGINLRGSHFSGNGYSPTNDSYNSGGKGTNLYALAGQLIMTGNTSGGSGASKPTTADIYAAGQGLIINGHWSDTHGKFLVQSGDMLTLSLNGVRHYEGSMNDTNTPTSLDVTAKLVLNGSYFFGDVTCTAGVSGSITSVGTKFYDTDLATYRPTLGKGTFKGDTVTTYHGLVSVNDIGNSAQIKLGGRDSGVALSHVGYSVPQLLSMGVEVGGLSAILQALGPASVDSGLSVFFEKSTGRLEVYHNCYVYDGSGNMRAHKTGMALRVIIGGTGINGLRVSGYNFPDTTTSIAFSSFVDMGGLVCGGNASTGTEAAWQLPQRSSNPSYSSGDHWEGSIYYNTGSNKARLNVGGSTWETITSA